MFDIRWNQFRATSNRHGAFSKTFFSKYMSEIYQYTALLL